MSAFNGSFKAEWSFISPNPNALANPGIRTPTPSNAAASLRTIICTFVESTTGQRTAVLSL